MPGRAADGGCAGCGAEITMRAGLEKPEGRAASAAAAPAGPERREAVT